MKSTFVKLKPMYDLNPAVREATNYIIQQVYDDELLNEQDREVIEMHVLTTLDWLVSCWRSEGPEVESLGRTFIAAALETTAHLENLVRMDEND